MDESRRFPGKNTPHHGADALSGTTGSFREELLRICRATSDANWLTLYGSDGERSKHSYRELEARIADYLAFYRRLGVQEQDVVLLVLQESIDLFASFYAGIIHGALPAFFAYPSPKQSVEVFLQSIEDLTRFNRVRAIVAIDDVASILTKESSAWCHAETVGCFRPGDVRSAGGEWGARDAAREAFLQFSSGTTGAKKGVEISARALFNQLDAYRPLLRFDDSSVVVSWLPHYHDMGLVACMLMPFLEEVPIVMMSPFEWVRNPRLLLSAIAQYRGTHVWLPNFALGHLTRSVTSGDDYDLRSLNLLVCCSEPVLQDTVRRFSDRFEPMGLKPAVMANCYAMAENTFAMTSTAAGPLRFLEADPEVLRREQRVVQKAGGEAFACAGRPLANLEVRILGSAGQPVDEYAIGEIAIRSDCLIQEYHGNPEATREAFADGWFRTGDLGFLHAGELYITGRQKDLLIVGGENIYPQDIELIVNDDPRLIPGRNVAFGVTDEALGTERVVVLAETQESLPLPTSELRKAILDRLNVAVAEIALLPHRTLRKGTAGKISRHLNKQRYLRGEFSSMEVPSVRSASSADPASTLNGVMTVLQRLVPRQLATTITPETSLLRGGVIDSFGFVALLTGIEEGFRVEIPAVLRRETNFDTPRRIAETVTSLLRDGENFQEGLPRFAEAREASRRRLQATGGARATSSRLEWLVNKLPVSSTLLHRMLFRGLGIRIGRNVLFRGRVELRIAGRPENIVIGDDVVFGPGVQLRNRENGRIVLNDSVELDQEVRLLAAREGRIEIGAGVRIGRGSVVNSGGDTTIGEYTLVGANCNINSSSHGIDPAAYIRDQPHTHGRVVIGRDVWLGAGASVVMNTEIGEGAVIGGNSLASGVIPAFAICAGVPARVLRYR